MSKIFQKGVSLYIALVILAIILGIVLGLNTILLGQIKMIRGMGYSVVAYYAAETGAERGFFKMNNCSDPDDFLQCVPQYYAESLDLDDDGNAWSYEGEPSPSRGCPGQMIDSDDSCYQFRKITDPDECVFTDYCFRIMGYYKETRRAIELKH